MKRVLIFVLSIVWSFWCLALFIFHWGTLTPPQTPKNQEASAQFYEKTPEEPVQHLVLIGPPHARGVKTGELTQHLLYAQEKELTTMLSTIFPWQPLFHMFELLIIPLFKGIEHKIPEDFLQEMHGVSLSTSKEFDSYAEAYTRQLAYHGLHEVGQMMVDQYQDDRMENMGCTALLAPYKNSWLVGRNFDFEGGPTLDEKKILKWVFPTDGKYAFVSVIWAGMVGSVTAINEHGLYLSINAAGSKDFNRHGLPSTLLATRVMDSAKNAEEALQLIRTTPIMITEIFVLVSSTENKAYRIEKSPTHTEIIPITEPRAITNHLHSEFWKHDATNIFRATQLTSHHRELRGEELMKQFPLGTTTPEEDMALRLRDKKGYGNHPLPLGNRRAIDPMIANHSVIFNGANNTLYVSSGPHLVDRYVGYDLEKSFLNKKPHFIRTLPADPEISKDVRQAYLDFTAIKSDISKNINNVSAASIYIERGLTLIGKYPQLEDMRWNQLRASFEAQSHRRSSAKAFLNRALSLAPPYTRDIKQIEEVFVEL